MLCLLNAVGCMWPTPSVPHDSNIIVPSAICLKTHVHMRISSPSIFSHMSCTFINHTGLWCFHMASQICLPTVWEMSSRKYMKIRNLIKLICSAASCICVKCQYAGVPQACNLQTDLTQHLYA